MQDPEGFKPCACLPSWFTDITDCALKRVCADCKQQVTAPQLGHFFSLFKPCELSLGKLHICGTHVHEDCKSTWVYEFEQTGHDKLCDYHPFTPDIIPARIMEDLHMACLARHLPPQLLANLVKKTRADLVAVQRTRDYLIADKVVGITLTSAQKREMLEMCAERIRVHYQKLSFLEDGTE
jgi:hypothetical protein